MAMASAEAPTPTRLAVLPLKISGQMSGADRDDLTAALIKGFERGAFTVIAPAEVVEKGGDPGTCADPACIIGVSSRTGAEFVAIPTVEVDDRDFSIEVGLYNGATGERVAVSQDSCEICGVVDASGLLDSAAATLGQKLDTLSKGPATLVLSATPEGAVVLVDGKLIGTAPLDVPMPPGKHVIRVSQDGFIPSEREMTFVEGIQEELSINLERMPSALPSRNWGWASLSVGVLSLGGALGLTLLDDRPFRIDGRCSTELPDPDANVMEGPDGTVCKDLWNTRWGALSAGVAGAALTTLGVLVLIDNFKRSDRSRKKALKKSRSTRVGIGPGSVMIQGRF